MRKKPRISDTWNNKNICFSCAWTSLGDMSNIYCHCHEETFNFEHSKSSKDGVIMKMSCPSFHPILPDIKRGLDFAIYFKSRKEKKISSIYRLIAIIIPVLALLFSILFHFTNK